MDTIVIDGVEVELHWGEGNCGVGLAVSTCDDVSDGPSDGEVFEYNGVQYKLGQHEYSDDSVVCTAPIYIADSVYQEADQDWAREQLESIEPTREACAAFDASEDGKRYKQITGITMSANLGANTLD